MRANLLQKKCAFVEVLTILQKQIKLRKDNEKTCAAGDSDRQWTERTPRKCFRCGSVNHLFAKYLKPPKDNKRQQKQVCFNERGNHA